MVESLCSCQIPSCLQDDIGLEMDCIHVFKHDHPYQIVHIEILCGKIVSYISCSRGSKKKKIFISNFAHDVYFKGSKHHVYVLPRVDVWFISKTPSVEEAFEMWNYGEASAPKYDIIFC